MAYITEVQKQSYRITPGENSHQDAITIDETSLAIDWQQIASLATRARDTAGTGGHYSLIIGGQSYDIFAHRVNRPTKKGGAVYLVEFAGYHFEVLVEDERTKLLSGLAGNREGTGEEALQAPMPGLVLDIRVEQGTAVTEGETVAILEAMKMENDLQAPMSGIVKEVRVQKGRTVDQGEILLIIAASPDAST